MLSSTFRFGAVYTRQLSLPAFPSLLIAVPASIQWSIPSIPSLLEGIWEGILRAVPKKKTSHSKKRHRQMAGKALKDVTSLCKCPACGQTKRMHYLCPHCLQSKSLVAHYDPTIFTDTNTLSRAEVAGQDEEGRGRPERRDGGIEAGAAGDKFLKHIREDSAGWVWRDRIQKGAKSWRSDASPEAARQSGEDEHWLSIPYVERCGLYATLCKYVYYKTRIGRSQRAGQTQSNKPDKMVEGYCYWNGISVVRRAVAERTCSDTE
jgi:large subunit ribosomal protein L32